MKRVVHVQEEHFRLVRTICSISGEFEHAAKKRQRIFLSVLLLSAHHLTIELVVHCLKSTRNI